MNNIVFIYSKNKQVVVLDMADSQEKHDKLQKDGYAHILTVDVKVFLESLLNNKEVGIDLDKYLEY